MKILTIIAIITGLNSFAFAKPTPIEMAKEQTAKACHKEYAKETTGKNPDQVLAWVEQEESGPNATAFKKSKCYAQHEKWETASGKTETGEENESKE